MTVHSLHVGQAEFPLELVDDRLTSLGGVRIAGVPMRNRATRFLPWFDTYEGCIFNRFRLRAIETRGDATVVALRAAADPDYPFVERRDSSGDTCLRAGPWDGPVQEVDFRIVLTPAACEIGGLAFAGFRYWFEYDGPGTPIHRLIDRQTWELSGNLDDVTLMCRNLFERPRQRVTRNSGYSTTGLANWAEVLPGNLWARWSLLPAFDMQVGAGGVMLGWFDRVSCIRSVIETTPGEDWVRYVDCHYFERSERVATNAKTILRCPAVLDETAALNLWTRVHDRVEAAAQRQFGLTQDSPAALWLGHNTWQGIDFDRSYEEAIDAAAELGVDYVFIDSIFQSGETFERATRQLAANSAAETSVLSKLQHQNMCCTFDFMVSETAGGEAGLQRLCARAAARGVGIMSWMAAHCTPRSTLRKTPQLGRGQFGIFAAKESGRHPDTGYPDACWTLNLNIPAVRQHLRDQILGICRRTGLAGFLWDSMSNLGWWQVDYSDGSMRPQFDHMGELFASLANAGLYLAPEGIVSFTSHSGCGLFGGNVFEGDLLGYAYKTAMVLGPEHGNGPRPGAHLFAEVIRGRAPFARLFQAFAHRCISLGEIKDAPRREWDPSAVEQVKSLFRLYRRTRHLMQDREVLPDGRGVLWRRGEDSALLYSFRDQEWPGSATDADSGVRVAAGRVEANRIYQVNDGRAP